MLSPPLGRSASYMRADHPGTAPIIANSPIFTNPPTHWTGSVVYHDHESTLRPTITRMNETIPARTSRRVLFLRPSTHEDYGSTQKVHQVAPDHTHLHLIGDRSLQAQLIRHLWCPTPCGAGLSDSPRRRRRRRLDRNIWTAPMCHTIQPLNCDKTKT